MSSPIHHADDLDPALVYAPPWVRDQARTAANGSAAAAPIQAPTPRRPAGQRRAFSGDPAMARLQQQRGLNPDRVPEPPFDNRRSAWLLARRGFTVSAIAALIACGLVLLPTTRNPATQAPKVAHEVAQGANETPAVNAPTLPAVNRVKLVHITATGPLPPAVAETLTPQTEPQAIAGLPEPQAAPSEQQAAPSEQKLATPGSDELAALVKRGEDYLKNGDFASARLLLRRAAEAGRADAALALGATFDPLVIKQLGAIGAEPDIGQARKWYETASKLGSQAASEELAKLTEAQH
jgi:hypothetical protein